MMAEFTANELGFYNGLFFSFDHHSSYSNADKNKCLENINQSLFSAHEFLKRTKVLFVTFGSAWVYLHEEKAVANCHKIPNHQFEKQLLQIENMFFLQLVRDGQVKAIFTRFGKDRGD